MWLPLPLPLLLPLALALALALAQRCGPAAPPQDRAAAGAKGLFVGADNAQV